MKFIEINGAREHNLKSVSVRIPRNRFILVTGVSGSGKSSLVQNVIANEGQRLYLSQLNPKARQYFGRMSKPELDSISGLSPVVALDQVSVSSNIRSTVGTLSELYDMLRLLFARYSVSTEYSGAIPSRSLFSFNRIEGACQACKGLGLEEYIDPDTFITNPDKSVMDGALSLSNPSGYVIYSQVTLDVLEQVCRAEGFELSIPWKDLNLREKEVILLGSEKIKIPFGKHPLESRMKWSGITAKPRDEGYYRGMIPIMEEILKRDRNKNILKYTRSRLCKTCQGKRLNRKALSYFWHGRDIADWTALPIEDLKEQVISLITEKGMQAGEIHILHSMLARMQVISNLGIDYLTLDRESSSLSFGEIKRIRLSTLLQDVLCGLIYTLDEPTVGLHPKDHENLLNIMREVCDKGNTLIVIDHKNIGFEYADYWIELGPGAGYKGGELLLAGNQMELKGKAKLNSSLSWAYLTGSQRIQRDIISSRNPDWIVANNVDIHNLKSISVGFMAHRLNIICGVSGAGKSTLLSGVMLPLLSGEKIKGSQAYLNEHGPIQKIIQIDQKPIGRNSRSNPATYTKLFDRIRALFGSLPESAVLGWDKSRFSFNVDGGRCPECKGAGAIEIGVSYLGSIEIVCESCQGKRFTPNTLEIRYRNKNIYEVLEMEVDEALEFFREEKSIIPYIKWLSKLGLGYLKLGQPSGTLSGGEAQRIKLATELVRPSKGHTVYMLDEPASGLHPFDIQILLNALDELVKHGHTLIMVEHDPDLVSLADWVVELGPGGGTKGGELIFSGTPDELQSVDTPMAIAIRKNRERRINHSRILLPREKTERCVPDHISMEGIRTNNLKGINIQIPENQVTAFTGVSGSGKTSLVYDTLYASAQFYFSQTFSSYVRSLIGGMQPGDFQVARGLLPALAIKQKAKQDNPRSTLATLSGILPTMRLLFSRFAKDSKGNRSGLLARQFSFNDKSGACLKCAGIGAIKEADPAQLITHPHLSVYQGAMKGTKAGRFFADPDGQYLAVLKAVEQVSEKNFSCSWESMTSADRDLILFGTDGKEYDVVWDYKRKSLTGSHRFTSVWKGIANLVTEEYLKRTGTTRQEGLENVMKKVVCPECLGHRINTSRLSYNLGTKHIAEWLDLTVEDFITQVEDFCSQIADYKYYKGEVNLIKLSLAGITKVLSTIKQLGMGYLQLNRGVASLSSGEYQRVRLASQLGSELTGLLYLIDEPSTALHPSNLEELWKVFQAICSKGNTVVMVDHNPLFYQNADLIYELGPEGGDSGGEIISRLERNNFLTTKKTGMEFISPSEKRAGFNTDDLIYTLHDLSRHNLRIKRISIPGGWTCIVGVSGSGKSTLMSELISQESDDQEIGQVIVPETARLNWLWHHNPLFGLGISDLARKEFCSSLQGAYGKIKPDFFIPTRKGGRCEDCQGKGTHTVSLDFLGQSMVKCDACIGTGYTKEAREIKSHGLSFDEFLKMPLEAILDSAYWPGIQPVIEVAVRMGLGYLKAGQDGNSLSPGEKQRLLLVRELCKVSHERNIFLFDEPTRGLHPKDSSKFILLIRELINRGHSVIMVEHHPELILSADWVIELGPGGGHKGGQMIYQGDPRGLIIKDNSPTGQVLKRMCVK